MKLKLIRKHPCKNCVIGELYVDNEFECYTCEDVERLEKKKGETAIPRGTYEVTITFSNRFKKLLPLLLNVPGYEGVRIHTGNTAADTEGCILPGRGRNELGVTHSADAFYALFIKLSGALLTEKIFIEITGLEDLKR